MRRASIFEDADTFLPGFDPDDEDEPVEAAPNAQPERSEPRATPDKDLLAEALNAFKPISGPNGDENATLVSMPVSTPVSETGAVLNADQGSIEAAALSLDETDRRAVPDFFNCYPLPPLARAADLLVRKLLLARYTGLGGLANYYT